MAPKISEARRAYNKEYYANNRAEHLSAMKARRGRLLSEDPVKYRRQRMLESARNRAKNINIVCTISLDDIEAPTHCPALGILLDYRAKGKTHAGANSPTLDRLVPSLGYVPGNVAVISMRANSIKHNATPREVARVAKWMQENVNND